MLYLISKVNFCKIISFVLEKLSNFSSDLDFSLSFFYLPELEIKRGVLEIH